MTKDAWNLEFAPATPRTNADAAADWRARAEAQRSDIALQRQRALAGQSSASNTPDERIRIWERLHALRLPLAADHPLLSMIAKSTGLTLGHIHDEQRQRAERAGTGPKRRVFDPYRVLPAADRER